VKKREGEERTVRRDICYAYSSLSFSLLNHYCCIIHGVHCAGLSDFSVHGAPWWHFFISGAPLSQKVLTVKWMSNQQSEWTPNIIRTSYHDFVLAFYLYFSVGLLRQSGKGQGQKYIRDAHLFSNKPSGLRIKFNKDSDPLSISVYLQQYCNDRQMKKPGWRFTNVLKNRNYSMTAENHSCTSDKTESVIPAEIC
jgi:hypothetical protein